MTSTKTCGQVVTCFLEGNREDGCEVSSGICPPCVTPDLSCHEALNGACTIGVDCSSVYAQLYGKSGSVKPNIKQEHDSDWNESVSDASKRTLPLHTTVQEAMNEKAPSSSSLSSQRQSFIMYAVIGLLSLFAFIGVVAFFKYRSREAEKSRNESENKLRPLTSISAQDAFRLYSMKEKDKFASMDLSQYEQAALSQRRLQAAHSVSHGLASTQLTDSFASDHSVFAPPMSFESSIGIMASYVSDVSVNELNDSRVESATESFDLSHQNFEEFFQSETSAIRKSRPSVEF